MKKRTKLKNAVIPIAASLLLVSAPLQSLAQSGVSYQEKAEMSLRDLLQRQAPQDQAKSDFMNVKQGEKNYQDNTYIVQYSSPLSLKEHQAAGVTVKKQLPKLGYDVISLPSKSKLESVIQTYKKNSKVISIKQSVAYQKLGSTDPKLDKMYHFSQLEIEKAQQKAGDREVKVAVIDGGIDRSHPDLKDNILSSTNIIDPMRKPVADMHGTHVAGIIAAQKGNEVGGMGVSPNAKIIGIDVFNGTPFTSDYSIAEGILHAIDSGAEIINMSLGSPMSSTILEEAVNLAVEAGITVVAAAGNSGVNEKSYPASYRGVISVGATDKKEKITEFSTYGPSVDLVAPGDRIYSTGFNGKSTFTELSGTSMASPVVAGTAALLKSADESLTPFQVEQILERSAKDLGNQGYDLTYGSGLVNPVAALNFDHDKLPEETGLSDEDILDTAITIDQNSNSQVKGTINKPGKTIWYKTDVDLEEFLQLNLKGNPLFDFGMELAFLPEGEDELFFIDSINDVAEGKEEGYLFESFEKGSILIGVYDTNGTGSENAVYTLSVEKSTELDNELNDSENPVQVTGLPYESEGHYLNGEEGDQDFFKFSVEEPQVIRVKTSALAGVDTGISILMGDAETGEEYEITYGNSHFISEGETVVFEAIPGFQYTAIVTNTPDYYEEFFEMDFHMARGSISPYKLTIEGKVLPEDLDGFPNWEEPEVDLIEENITLETYAKQKMTKKEEEPSEELPEFEEEIDFISEFATPYQIGEKVSEYIQFGDDIDLYKFVPEESGIYQIGLASEDGVKPIMELMQYDENYGWMSVQANLGMDIEGYIQAGLHQGETYALAIFNWDYAPTFEPYELTSSRLAKIEDVNEPNDSEAEATMYTGETIEGNLAFSSDLDMYYVESGEEGIFGFTVKPDGIKGTPPAEYKESPIDPMVFIVEDANANGIIDPEEYESVIALDTGWDNEIETGSFKRKESSGYFLVVANYAWHANRVPLSSYVIALSEANPNDEDADSDVENNVPSKPLTLSEGGQANWKAEGFMNYKEQTGDIDWYILNNLKNTTADIHLEVPIDMDGELSVYDKKGNLLASGDYYGRGDGEFKSIQLTESGPVYIAVSSSDDNPSIEPYELIVNLDTKPSKNTVERISGPTRFDTSLAFAKRLPDHTLDHVIIASGNNYPDALSGGVLNKVVNGTTILVSDNNTVLEKALEETKRLLKPGGKVVILGGKKAVSDKIEQQFKKEFTVSRIAGANRTATSVEIAKKASKAPEEVIVASGLDFADVLSVVPYATQKTIPVLLNSSKSGLNQEIADYIKQNNIKKVTVIGGKKAITEEAMKKITSLGVKDLTRVSGSNRYLTSVEVAKKFYPQVEIASLANGENFPDGLSGSHFASIMEMPILLVKTDQMADETKRYIQTTGIDSFYIYGGTKAVSENLLSK
ncbi:S8 family serine peptidase [Bacillus sp. ISL-55]|uniref:S8 family serine peptidase n=1 Tax=Bacillus sp. ISL-55 TaxID=2819134 RepID=UPI001BE7A797|nr:S8 family serine peptidase [Bacillus sp. ISL-55]MBT2693709.1 S8 family serine peptidase [Bacillus sp. ISL-55]